MKNWVAWRARRDQGRLPKDGRLVSITASAPGGHARFVAAHLTSSPGMMT
jgi:hypothetical protein